MTDIALKSKIPQTKIDFCERNHPNDAEEQTKELLQVWVESQGNNAATRLIELLQNSQKVKKADEVKRILSGSTA